MFAIKEYILVLVLVLVATTAQSATEDDYPEVELPGVVLPPSSGFKDNVHADPTCLPDQWQANITSQTGISGGRRDGGKLSLVNNMAIYFDRTNNRIAGKGDGGGRYHNKSGGFVMLFNDTKADFYLFSYSDQKCKHIQVKNATFKPQCIPANSTMQEVTLGPADGGLKVQAWRFRAKSPEDRRGIKYFISGTFMITDSKLPVASQDRGIFCRGRPHEDTNAIIFDQSEDDTDEGRRERRGSTKFVSNTFYSSAKASIDDPDVFKPPTYCNATVTAMSMDYLLNEEEEFTEILERFVSF